jgi:hypothetical protein
VASFQLAAYQRLTPNQEKDDLLNGHIGGWRGEPFANRADKLEACHYVEFSPLRS